MATSASSDTDEEVDLAAKTSWNLKGLRAEVGRQVVRHFKKVSKADERLRRVRPAPHASLLTWMDCGFTTDTRFLGGSADSLASTKPNLLCTALELGAACGAGRACLKRSHAQESAKVEELMSLEDPPMEALEQVGDVDALRVELEDARARLASLNQLEDGLQSVKSTAAAEFAPLAATAVQLGINDSPPPR